MQLHQLKRKTALKGPKRVGRGGKRGKTAGRGTKGQKARAGHRIRPELRDIIKKFPKLRGYKFKAFRENYAPVNVSTLESEFAAGATIDSKVLVEKGLVSRRGGKIPPVKILATGTLTKKFSVVGCAVSATAKAKIEAAGGKVTE